MKTKIKDRSLYLVTGEDHSRGRSTPEIVDAAIRGGVDIVQMREKNFSREKLIELGSKLALMCRRKGVTFIVNDDPYIARELGADGVHLGQEDIAKYPPGQARRILGPESIIGISTHSVEEAVEASNTTVDYIAYGPVFKTKTKDYFIGTGGVKEVLEKVSKPVIFIGGINTTNMIGLLEQGARNVAMIRYLTQADDIEKATGHIKDILTAYGPDPACIEIKLNGRSARTCAGKDLLSMVTEQGLIPENVVVEHNYKIAHRDKWRDTILNAGDNVEMIAFVGGG